MSDTPLDIARKATGGKNVDLAKLLGITESAVSQWKTVPPDRAIEIEQKTNGKVTRYDLRPDYFGQPDTSDTTWAKPSLAKPAPKKRRAA